MLADLSIKWIIKKFRELTTDELYALLRLRSEVFVVEQNCVFLDMDNKDQESLHLMGFLNEQLVAYTRLMPAGLVYDLPSIGRVVTSASVRGSGTGRLLMQKSIEEIRKISGQSPIKIGAQLYLKDFYSSLGFAQTSGIYLEDGIEHIEMVLS